MSLDSVCSGTAVSQHNDYLFQAGRLWKLWPPIFVQREGDSCKYDDARALSKCQALVELVLNQPFGIYCAYTQARSHTTL
jgi:hypothetical protein